MFDLFSGLRVVECPAFVAAPLCGNTLAQLGAEVIRIDPLQGGLDYGRWPVNEAGCSLYWAGLNNAKRSIAIDLQSAEGQALAEAIITAPGEGGGIFSTNLAPDWARYDNLRAARPDLIMLSIEGHPDGRSAVDYTVNAEAGLPFLTGHCGPRSPINHSLPAWDVTTGLHGALALVGAERRRRRTGEGAHLRLALSDVAFATMSTLAYTSEVEVNKTARGSVGNYVYGTFGRDFLTRDRTRVMIVAVTNRQWVALGRATGLEATFAGEASGLHLDFAREGDRFIGRDVVAGHLARWCASRDLVELERIFSGTGVCWGCYRSVADAVRLDRRFTSSQNPVFEKVDHPDVGQFTTAGSVIRIEGSQRRPIPPAPCLGQHTRAVLKDVLGLSDREVGQLQDHGIVAKTEDRR